MAHDIFISYATPDRPVAQQVCAALETRGLRCCIDHRDFPIGANWMACITQGIDACRAVVLILSRHTQNSTWVGDEVAVAKERHKRIFPMRLDQEKLPDALESALKTIHYLDASAPPLEQHVTRLTETALAWFESTAPAAETPSHTPAPATPAPLLASGVPVEARVPWDHLPEKIRELATRLLSALKRGEFTRLNLLVLSISATEKKVPLVRVLQRFCRGAVGLALDAAADNPAQLETGLAGCLDILAADPALYEMYAEVLRSAVRALAAQLLRGTGPGDAAALRGQLRDFALQRVRDSVLGRALTELEPSH